jgi:branched-chain amino acid transport system permease protein
MLIQQLINGVMVGSVYALFALGFTLTFGVMNILNLAHGAVFAAGAFGAQYLVGRYQAPLYLVVPIVMCGGALLSMVLEMVAFRPLRRRGANEFGAIVSSIGAGLILTSILEQISGAAILTFPFGAFPVMIFRVAGIRISLLQVTVLVATALAIAAVLFYLYRTSFGRQVRAVAVNENTADLLGVNPSSVYLQIFAIAGGLAGLAGFLIGLMFNSVHFLMGEPMMLRAFVVVILGGMGSVTGAVLAGLFVGIAQTLIAVYISTKLSDAILFSVLFVVLLIYPTGFFKGLRVEQRVGRS